jgi:nitrogen regulatory protein PII
MAMLLLSSSTAFAAGYTCLSVDTDTKAIVYFAAPASPADVDALAAPEAKQVVFIDPALSKKTQVLAVFESEKSVLSTRPSGDGVVYVSTVEEGIKNPGKHLGGTRVGLLAEVSMTVQTVVENARMHSLGDGVMYAAEVVYTKKNGETLAQDFDCALFLGDAAPDVP